MGVKQVYCLTAVRNRWVAGGAWVKGGTGFASEGEGGSLEAGLREPGGA